MNEPLTLDLTHDGKPIADLTENEITIMEPIERVGLITDAQRYITNGGSITPDQSANLTRLLIHVRRRAVQDNPRASAKAKAAAEVKPASLDDI